MTNGQKFCLLCKRGHLQSWESLCSYCWKKVEEHDLCWICKGTGTVAEKIGDVVSEIIKCPNCGGTGYKGKWREGVKFLNSFREILLSCGIDLFDAPW